MDTAIPGAATGTRPDGRVSRRAVLRAALAGAAALAGPGGVAGCAALDRPGSPGYDATLIERVEAARPRSGVVRNLSVTARAASVDLGGPVVPALTYDGTLPGPVLRASAGDLLRVAVTNRLDQPTSVHWHGVALRNDADGVPGVTGPLIAVGASSTVQFVVPDPGTYWFHPHVGLQLDWGLSAPLIVDDPAEPGRYDHELVVVLDDWSAGLGATPEQLLADLRSRGSTMGGTGHGPMAGPGGMGGGSDAGDVAYPAYLANGRLSAAAHSLDAAAGQRIRLRIVNAAADTVFDVAVAGHRMTVTHSDGFPLRPVDVDTIRLSMGERYDATITAREGVHPLVAVPVGKAGTPARILIRTAAGATPPAALLPAEVSGRRLQLADLVAADSVRWPSRAPDTVQDVVLSGGMRSYRWTINGRTYDETRPLPVRHGQTTRLRIVNRTMMQHPVHLHGHTFAVRNGGDARKDTVGVPAMARVDVDVRADNPGAWMLHCHNAFHMEAGMMTRLDYVS
jgi:multicopper oxidase